jgi:predicted ATPase/class 3 adenylate cyclase
LFGDDAGVRGLPAGTVTLLFTDIEGSTRLLAEYGDEYPGLLAAHRRRLRDAARRHRGVEVDTQGDAFFFAFRQAGDAAAAAGEAQRALTDGPVRVRMGLHTGEPTLTDEGYVGIDVHRAARICSVAHGGQVVVSARTAALVDVPLTDLGVHRLKDLGEVERLFQLGDRRFPPLRSLNATNLPAQPGPLVGRDRELAEVAELLSAHRLVTVTGAGGSGKTRFALQAAADLTVRFPDGVFWVSLAAVNDPELVLPMVAATIGAKAGAAEYIDERRMLLLLDNVEQILGCAPALSDLLQTCPNLRLLVTSRALLRLAAEHEFELLPLPETDGVTLFRRLAADHEPESVVREICRRLDGLPLAIELAAARTRLLPPEQLLARLERRLPLLTGGSRDAPARQQTLRATIEWSYELLDPAARATFSRLGVFAGGFDVAAAEEVCGVDVDELQMLVEQSLLRRSDEGRLFLLETIREFALGQLDDPGIHDRRGEYYRRLAESANVSAEADGEQRHGVVLRNLGNIRAALEWFDATDDEQAPGW